MFSPLILLPLLTCFFHKNAVLATNLSSDNEPRRQRLPSNLPSIIQYLRIQHSLGNWNSRFAIRGTAKPSPYAGSSSDSLEWRLNMQELPFHRLAISTNANFSIYGREQRAVGDLGYSFLSVDLNQDQRSQPLDASYAFLIVDWSSARLRGVVVKSSEVTYVDENSSIFVEPSLNDAELSREEITSSQPPLTADFSPFTIQFQINLAVDINRSLVRQIGGGSLCHTIAYINSLLTAINGILEYEVHARLNVDSINQTSFYDNIDDSVDYNLASLGRMISSQANFGARRNDTTYVFLGRDSNKFDSESNAASMHTTLFNTVCGPQHGLGVITDWKGNAISWGEGWFMDLNELLTLVGRTIGSKVTHSSLLSEHIASINRLFSGTKSDDDREIQRPPTGFSEMKSFLVAIQQEGSCVLTPSNFGDIETIHPYAKNECPIISSTTFSTEARAFVSSVEMSDSATTSYFPTSATISPESATSNPISTTNSPASATNSPARATNSPTSKNDSPAIATIPPTDGLFKTKAPIRKPTTRPTISWRPTGEDLPTASNPPMTATPVKPPTPLFPTYSPTEGSELPTTGIGNQTYPPTVDVLYPTAKPSIRTKSSLTPSSKPSFVPFVAPTMEPSSSLIPTELYRPSATPSQSSNPSAPPSEHTIAGDITNSILNPGTTVSSFGCSSSTPAEDLIFDGTTKEFTCDEQDSLNPTRRITDQGFIITPNLANPSIVEKLRVYAGHSCSDCDAVTYTIQGWAENEWVLISSDDLPWRSEEPTRNDPGKSITNSTYDHGDEALTFTEIILNNSIAFSMYRLTFPETRNGAFSLVVAEVELPGRTFEITPSDLPTAQPSKLTPSKPTIQPVHSTSKPTTRSTGAKTSKPTGRRTTRPTRRKNKRTHKPTPRPFRERSETSSKTTKSKTSAGFPGSKWDDIFFIETEVKQKSTYVEKKLP